MEREYQKVMTYIKEQIARGEIGLGDKLPTERELAQTLLMGRYSIREAIRIMEALGMVESRQGSGNYLVTDMEKYLTQSMELMLVLNQIDYQQIGSLRRIMEGHAFECALERMEDNQLETLRQILTNMKNSTGSARAKWDQTFHDTILLSSQNKLLLNIMGSLSNVCSAQIEEVVLHATGEEWQRLLTIHETILLSLETKDLLLGQKAIGEHYAIVSCPDCHG
ncbi:MAG: GntR family transcriptional regulator, transcriptional repressor for pyruvate dehydrogenase complex [Clostridiales bacterium]|nr:GntR family transcriptional regulator, transcriptional repressor for pyruvate dehydrogenase complex [Clostridiales bacterium]